MNSMPFGMALVTTAMLAMAQGCSGPTDGTGRPTWSTGDTTAIVERVGDDADAARIMIEFSDHALDRAVVCYTYPPPTFRLTDSLHAFVRRQTFPVAGRMLRNRALSEELEAECGGYFRRMTAANPCADTISISRSGDTLRTTMYNWMILILPDSSRAGAAIATLARYRSEVHMAERTD